MSLSLLYAGLAGVGLAAGAGVATVVLLTSGPAADRTDDEPLFAATATAVIPTPTTPPATPTPPAATPTATAASPTPAVLALDAHGWPIPSCPAGSEIARTSHKRIATCAPPGWRIVTDHRENNPPGFWGTNVVAICPQGTVQIAVFAKRGVVTWAMLTQECLRPQPAELLGYPAQVCIARPADVDRNGLHLTPQEAWAVKMYAQTSDDLVLLEASGTEFAPSEAEAAIERALDFGSRARHNGVQTVSPR